MAELFKQSTSPANGSPAPPRHGQPQSVRRERRDRRVRAGRCRAGARGDRRGEGGVSRRGRRARSRSARTSSTARAARSSRARTSSGTLLSREEGKTLPEGVGEATRAGQIFKFFAGEVVRMAGEKLAVGAARASTSRSRASRSASIGLITPWNFPIAIPAWKIAPALAYGNTVVFKPADLVPGCAWALADILARAGHSARRVQPGDGPRLGRRRDARQPSRRRRRSASPARSAPAARIAAKAIARMAKVQLEMGGKNPLVVLDDADLPTAVNCRGAGRVLLDRPALHGVVAPDRHRGHPRPLRRGGDGEAASAQGRRRARAGHRHRPGRRSEPARPGPEVPRDRQRRGREARRPAASG